jgi:hypothetical protein
MSTPTTGNVILDIVIAGGIVALAVETLREFLLKWRDQKIDSQNRARDALMNEMIRKREEFIQLSKEKVAEISNLVPIYMEMSGYHLSLATQLKVTIEGMKKTPSVRRIDHNRCLYCISNIFFQDNLLSTKGYFQFCDTRAEKIASDLNFELAKCFMGLDPYTRSLKLDYRDRSLLSYQAYDSKKESVPYFVFSNKIVKLGRYQNFTAWLDSIPLEDLETMESRSRWFATLIVFEMNLLYSRFYERKPHPETLGEDLRNFIRANYEKYDEEILVPLEKELADSKGT